MKKSVGLPITSYSTSKQREQRERAQRMAAELREHHEVRRAFRNVAAKLRVHGENEEAAQPVSLRDGLAARVDAIFSRKVEDES